MGSIISTLLVCATVGGIAYLGLTVFSSYMQQQMQFQEYNTIGQTTAQLFRGLFRGGEE